MMMMMMMMMLVQLLNVSAVVIANLCVSYIKTNQREAVSYQSHTHLSIIFNLYSHRSCCIQRSN